MANTKGELRILARERRAALAKAQPDFALAIAVLAEDLEIAPGVVTPWMKLAIRDRVQDEAAESDYSDSAGPAELTESDADRLTKD